MPHVFYLSDILGHTVFDSADRNVGRLHDVAAYMGPTYPVVTKIRVRTRRKTFGKRRLIFVNWSEVLGMEGPNLILKASLPTEEPELRPRELLLWKNVLDKQMVDVSGRKIVRVNDVALGTTGRTLRVTGVAIGGAAVLRRLGFLRLARLIPIVKLRDTVVPWESVVPLDYTADQRPAQRADGAAGKTPYRRPGGDPERDEPLGAIHGLRFPRRRHGGRHHRGVRTEGAGRAAGGDRRRTGAGRGRGHGAR